VPFVWAGKQQDFWSGIVTGWWSQIEGQSGISQYLRLDNAEQYNQAGRLKALTLFENIILDKTNSLIGSENMTQDEAASAFFEGKAAMMPAYSWTEYKYSKTNFNAQVMSLPIIDSAANPTSTYFMSGDFICIPSKAKNVALAKEFIEFTSSENNISYFTTETGTPRPFDIVIDDTYLNSFEKSNLDIWKSPNKIFMYSYNPIYYSNYLDWPYSGDPYMQIFYGDETATSIIDKNYNYAKEHWNAK
jgi:N-acetylglucosamine transport system substrate-binding protein